MRLKFLFALLQEKQDEKEKKDGGEEDKKESEATGGGGGAGGGGGKGKFKLKAPRFLRSRSKSRDGAKVSKEGWRDHLANGGGACCS